MKSRTTRDFRKRFNDLPTDVRDLARKAYALWLSDPSHPGVNFKRVSDKQPIDSARITQGYRALGYLRRDTVYWFWIGTHAEYDQMLQRM